IMEMHSSAGKLIRVSLGMASVLTIAVVVWAVRREIGFDDSRMQAITVNLPLAVFATSATWFTVSAFANQRLSLPKGWRLVLLSAATVMGTFWVSGLTQQKPRPSLTEWLEITIISSLFGLATVLGHSVPVAAEEKARPPIVSSTEDLKIALTKRATRYRIE